MFSKVEPPNLDPKQPWEGDLFEHKKFAAVLCDLLKKTLTSSVIGIDAPYGFGKTFFLRRLREQIKNDNGWIVYVNAWEYDYFDNPLFSLLDALKVAAGELPTDGKSKKVILEIGKAAAPAIAKAAARRLFEKVVGDSGLDDVSDAIIETTGKSVDRLIKQFSTDDPTHKALEVFRERTHDLISKNIDKDSPYQNLIIIVDELDRARPSFSIRFLETIKHLFSSTKIIFIIGCDRAALISSARHEYGADLNADGYLRRLFDYWIHLPTPKPAKYAAACAQRLNLITDKVFSENPDNIDSIKHYSDFLLLGRRDEDVSLRFVEQAVAHAGVVLRIAHRERYHGLIGFLQMLRHFEKDLYQRYVGNVRLSEIYADLKKHRFFHDARDYHKAWMILWAGNNAEPLTQELANQLFGSNKNLYETVIGIGSHFRYHMDYTESAARDADRLIRTIFLST
jgi:hypothetical protein